MKKKTEKHQPPAENETLRGRNREGGGETLKPREMTSPSKISEDLAIRTTRE